MIWRVRVETPDGEQDAGTYGIISPTAMAPERIADALADIAWRIVMDLAGQASRDEETEET